MNYGHLHIDCVGFRALHTKTNQAMPQGCIFRKAFVSVEDQALAYSGRPNNMQRSKNGVKLSKSFREKKYSERPRGSCGHGGFSPQIPK